uniref:HECT domain-containing protein n=1 Tax=Oryzias melastigma TaxID=30732 RepID=A0A3B3D9D2_ORYME
MRDRYDVEEYVFLTCWLFLTRTPQAPSQRPVSPPHAAIRDLLLGALSPEFSEDGSVRRQKEIKIINFLQDFLQELEDNGTTGKNPLSVPSFLQWTTGQAHIPLIQSEKEAFKINITFEHDCDTRYGQHTICYPTVNACSAAITFPTQHYVTYSDFEKNILQAICGGYKFSRYCTQDNLLLMSILGYIL